MHLLPKLQLKPFSTCKAGELIRVPWAHGALSIVAGAEDPKHRFIVTLEDDGHGSPTPCYVSCNNDDFHTLSYGEDFSLELNFDGPSEIKANKLWDINGAISIADSGWYMRTLPMQGTGRYHPVYFDLTSNKIGGGPNNERAVFAHWYLRLKIYGDVRDPILVKFKPAVP